MSKIKVVRFGRLKSYGSFENMRIDIETEVGKDELPTAVLDSLQQQVDDEIAKRINQPYLDRYANEVEAKRKELYELETKVGKLSRKLAKMQELFAEEVEVKSE